MACAQTGSGKTDAFCFPIISGIMRGQAVQSPHGFRTVFPLALILSPTRELSFQIHLEARKFAYQTGVKVVVVYGGAPINQQLRELERGVDILVGTPVRLVDLLERAKVSLQIQYILPLNFTCVELCTVDQQEGFPEAMADPEGLVWQVLNASWDALY